MEFRGQVGGTKRASLKEIFPEALGIEPLIGLGILPHHHHPEVPGPGQERLDHQGKGEGLQAGQTVERLETRPETDPQPQMGPVPFGHHRPRQASIS